MYIRVYSMWCKPVSVQYTMQCNGLKWDWQALYLPAYRRSHWETTIMYVICLCRWQNLVTRAEERHKLVTASLNFYKTAEQVSSPPPPSSRCYFNSFWSQKKGWTQGCGSGMDADPGKKNNNRKNAMKL